MTAHHTESIPELVFKRKSKSKNLYLRFKAHNSIPVDEVDDRTVHSLRVKLSKETDYRIVYFPDNTYRIAPKSVKIRKPFIRKHPTGRVSILVDLMKSGAEMDIEELAEYFNTTPTLTRCILAAARKWLAKEDLFISNDGNGKTRGKYKLMSEDDVSAESSRRYNLIGTHFNNVQDLITSGMEQYGDNPEIASHLENLILTIQEQQISHRRRLLSK